MWWMFGEKRTYVYKDRDVGLPPLDRLPGRKEKAISERTGAGGLIVNHTRERETREREARKGEER